eukprot:c14616_g1_i1.p1 GENE.c14616_g1_i1~~c14616_g1_i1.p1  ORF type:complete len:388 (+),score=29.87 c14616_g1_i1:77-1165(+)
MVSPTTALRATPTSSVRPSAGFSRSSSTAWPTRAMARMWPGAPRAPSRCATPTSLARRPLMSTRCRSTRAVGRSPSISLRRPPAAGVPSGLTVFFERAITPTDATDVAFTDRLIPMVWAVGETTPSGSAEAAFVAQHSSHSTSDIKINFLTGETKTDNLRERIRTAHGVVLFFAWVLVAPLGSLVARYCKDLMGVWWFRVHVGSQLLVAAATIAGFGMGVWMTVADFKGANVVHKILGLVIFIATMLQCLLGFVADRLWSPSRTRTPVVPDKLHWWFGRLLMLAGIVNCFLGLYSISSASTTTVVLFAVAVLLVLVLGVVMHFVFGGQIHHNALPDESSQSKSKPKAKKPSQGSSSSGVRMS